MDRKQLNLSLLIVRNSPISYCRKKMLILNVETNSSTGMYSTPLELSFYGQNRRLERNYTIGLRLVS